MWSSVSPIAIQLINSRQMRLMGHVTGIGQSVTAYGVLLVTPEGKWPLGRPRHTREDNINVTTQQNARACAVSSWLRKETGGNLLWPEELKFWFSKMRGISWPGETIILSWKILLHGFIHLFNQPVSWSTKWYPVKPKQGITIQLSWNMFLSHWARSFRRFDGPYCLQL